jgi:uncharacterized phage-associated protein
MLGLVAFGRIALKSRHLCVILRDMRVAFLLRPKPPAAYDETKAAQIAAFFALRYGGVADVLSLAKIMYLAERESYAKYGIPLTGDRLCSMPHGPVLSETLNYIRNEPETPEVWLSYFAPRQENDLPLRDPQLSEDALLRLSTADVELLNKIWNDFGHMSSGELWAFTHHELPEYEPTDSSIPIKMNVLLSHLGYAEAQAAAIIERVEEQHKFSAALKMAAV